MDYYECGLYGGFLLSGPGGWAVYRLAGVGISKNIFRRGLQRVSARNYLDLLP